MSHSIPIVHSWSSGKDAALALHYLLQPDSGYRVKELLTTVSSQYNRIVMHGTPASILDKQAAAIGLPIHKIELQPSATDEMYKNTMHAAMKAYKAQGINHISFGDLFLEDLKAYRENQLAAVEMKAIFPLWKTNTTTVVQQLDHLGFEAIIVCIDAQKLDKCFLGRKVDSNFLNDLPKDVDPAGENGEFHTLVINAPYFKHKIEVNPGEIVYKTFPPIAAGQPESGFYYMDVW